MQLKDLEYRLDNYYNHHGLKDAINVLDGLKAEYEALYDSSSGIDYSGMPHSSTPSNPPLEAVCHMADKPETLMAEINLQRAKILEIHRINHLIEQALHSIEPREEEIIHLRHCERMGFKQIGKATYYCEEWAKKKYHYAIRKMQGAMGAIGEGG